MIWAPWALSRTTRRRPMAVTAYYPGLSLSPLWNLPEVGTPEAVVLSDSQAGEETVDDGGEVNEDDFWDEGIPFF